MTLPVFPRHDDAWMRERLQPPTGRPRVVIDTDAANEIDDQFAIAWALQSTDRLELLGLYAEPFSFAHRRSDHPEAPADAMPFNPPAVGMERSYREAVKVYELLGLSPAGRVFRGSAGYLPGPGQPLHSEAVDHLIATAREHAPGGAPLYVLALGCVTNIASALLLAPDITERIVVVWTSGYPSHAPQVNDSFNLEQDMVASRWLLDSGVPHVYLPGFHVGAQLRLCGPHCGGHVVHPGFHGQAPCFDRSSIVMCATVHRRRARNRYRSRREDHPLGDVAGPDESPAPAVPLECVDRACHASSNRHDNPDAA